VKLKKGVQYYQRFWVIGLIVALFMVNLITDTDAQALKSKITIGGADDTFERTLSQPAQFLQRIGLTPNEIQEQLRVRSRILVTGAGVVRNLEMVWFRSAQAIQTSIQLEGAGAVRVVALAAFTEVTDQQSSKPGIHVAGAGSVRNVGLVAPVEQ
jgi:hypothetical protein